MEFDMIGVNPAVANTFRRIMIAEVCVKTKENREEGVVDLVWL